MSEKVQDHIFDLIQSMQKSERRYFKIYASRHVIGEENNYEALFDFCSKQDAYNEDALRAHFAGEPMLNNLNMTLHRLYGHLLKALEAYHASSSIDLELRHLLNCAEILFNKSLYDACRKLCNKIKKLAQQHDRQIALLEHNNLVKRLMEAENYEKIKGRELGDILNSDKHTLDDLTRISELWFVKSTLLHKLNTEGRAKTDEDKKFYRDFSVKLTMPKSEIFEEQYLYYHTQAVKHFALSEHKECLQFIEKNLELFEQHPEKKEEHLSRYISLLSNATYLNQILLDINMARNYLRQLKLLYAGHDKNRSDDLAIKLFNSTFSAELMMNIHTGKFEGNLEILPEIKSQLKAFKGKISVVRETYFNYCFAISYLATNQAKAALKCINAVLNNENSRKVQDMVDASKVLQLIALTELRESAVVSHLAIATKRQLINRKKWNDFEKLLFRYLIRWSKAEKIWEVEELFADFVEHLEKNHQHYSASAIYHVFPFRFWAESKFKNKSVSACVQEQFSARLK
jgi:hypothetical protein